MKTNLVKAYLKDSAKCPHCQSKDIDGNEIQCEGDSHYQTIQCNNCGRSWVDIYTLTDVDLTEVLK